MSDINDPLTEAVFGAVENMGQMRAEIERLTAGFSQSAHDLAVARARIGQLQAALRHLGVSDEWIATRAALEGK